MNLLDCLPFFRNRGFLSLNCVVLLAFTLSSCVTQRKVEYIQDSNRNIRNFTEPDYPDYRLKPNDELFIKINSIDEAAANVFSSVSQQPLSLDPYSASMLAYSIDKAGYLLLPVIGNVYVKDKTIPEVSRMLTDSLFQILNQPSVTIKLVNRFVSVLGEVQTPGHFPFSQEKLSAFDALGLAGDITDYGKPDNVILIRNENGENIRVNLDLTKSEFLTSDFYYLKPNDILYVKPLKNKFLTISQVPLSILFSTITTGLLIYNIFK